MSFKITKDLIAEEFDSVGGDLQKSRVGFECYRMPLYGIERMMGEDDSLPNEGPTTKFRLLDDDGEVYYEGELHDDPECENQSAALRWGEADAGCTIIEVWRGRSPNNNEGWTREIG